MAEKLILHIGATKTGTSAIQSALVRNRETLLERGVVVPEGRRDEKAEEGRVTGGNGWILHGFRSRHAKTPKVAVSRLEKKIASYVADPRCSTVLFSSEKLGGYEAGELEPLKAVLDKFFPRIQVVYYVRHLTDHAVSQYNEFVKRRRRSAPFADFAPRYRAPFKATIATFETVFGRDAFTCVLYDDVRASVFPSFLETIGVSPEGLEEPDVVNRSLTADEIEVMRFLNAKPFNRVLTSQVVEDFLFRNPPMGRRQPAVTRADIKIVETNNRADLDHVNARLGGRSRLLAASDSLMAAADDAADGGRELNPDIVLALLESSLRVGESKVSALKAIAKRQPSAQARSPSIVRTIKRRVSRMLRPAAT